MRNYLIWQHIDAAFTYYYLPLAAAAGFVVLLDDTDGMQALLLLPPVEPLVSVGRGGSGWLNPINGLSLGRSGLRAFTGLSGRSGLFCPLDGCGLQWPSSLVRINWTKLSGKTPTRPLSSPFHQPRSSTSFVRMAIVSPSLIVNSSSFCASYEYRT